MPCFMTKFAATPCIPAENQPTTPSSSTCANTLDRIESSATLTLHNSTNLKSPSSVHQPAAEAQSLSDTRTHNTAPQITVRPSDRALKFANRKQISEDVTSTPKSYTQM